MSRKKVSALELHEILMLEFRGTAGDSCLKCRIPMPAYFAPGAASGLNWRVGGIDDCSSLCHTILEDLVAKLSSRYELKKPGRLRS
jgi:hypothetical protein